MMIEPGPQHEAFKQDVIALLGKHGAEMNAVEMLALASIMVGQIIALQDHRTMTPQMAMEIVMRNIAVGNEGALAELN